MLHSIASYLTSSTALATYQVILLILVIPLANEVVNKYKGTRAGSVMQMIALILLKIPFFGVVLAKLPALGDLLYIFAPEDKNGLPKPLHRIYLDRKSKHPTPPTPPSEPPVALSASLLPFLLTPMFLLASCGYCREAVHADEPRCVLEQNMIKCGEQAGFSLFPIIGSIIVSAIGGNLDPNAIVNQLEVTGVKNIPCVLAALEDYIAGNISKFPPATQSFTHRVLVASLAKKNFRGNVKITLASGHAIEAVVP